MQVRLALRMTHSLRPVPLRFRFEFESLQSLPGAPVFRFSEDGMLLTAFDGQIAPLEGHHVTHLSWSYYIQCL